MTDVQIAGDRRDDARIDERDRGDGDFENGALSLRNNGVESVGMAQAPASPTGDDENRSVHRLQRTLDEVRRKKVAQSSLRGGTNDDQCRPVFGNGLLDRPTSGATGTVRRRQADETPSVRGRDPGCQAQGRRRYRRIRQLGEDTVRTEFRRIRRIRIGDENRNSGRAHDLVADAAAEETMNSIAGAIPDDDEIRCEHIRQHGDLGSRFSVANARLGKNTGLPGERHATLEQAPCLFLRGLERYLVVVGETVGAREHPRDVDDLTKDELDAGIAARH